MSSTARSPGHRSMRPTRRVHRMAISLVRRATEEVSRAADWAVSGSSAHTHTHTRIADWVRGGRVRPRWPALMGEPLNAFVATAPDDVQHAVIDSIAAPLGQTPVRRPLAGPPSTRTWGTRTRPGSRRGSRARRPSGNFSLAALYSAARRTQRQSPRASQRRDLGEDGARPCFLSGASATFRSCSASARSILTSGSVSYALAAALRASRWPPCWAAAARCSRAWRRCVGDGRARARSGDRPVAGAAAAPRRASRADAACVPGSRPLNGRRGGAGSFCEAVGDAVEVDAGENSTTG